MYTTIDGFDHTNDVDHDTISLQQAINDPLAKCDLGITDNGSQFTFDFGQEVIIWDENAPPQRTISGQPVASIPAHNLVQLPNVSGASGGAWASTGALSIFNSFPGLFPNTVFNNTTYTAPNNYQYITAITPVGYIHAGQQYLFSVYATISAPLVNALAVIQIQFQDRAGNLLGSPGTSTFASTTNNAQQRVTISATAPTGAAFCQVWFGGQATVSGTNSGTINWGTPQLEPMYFTAQGVSYPTPDCNFFQVDCVQMPDGTTSRAVRLFSGYIDDIEITYEGRVRTWAISCAGPGALLENGLINALYTGQYDSQIITNIINTYFSGQISLAAPNSSSPAPIQQGALVDNVSYSDNSLRDIMNSLVDTSGFIFYLDMYYTLHYQPQYYSAATFTLSNSPDNVASFPYYEYTFKKDGTQVKRRVKILGGKFKASITETFNGDGTTKQFNLTYNPDSHAVSVGGSSKKVGVYGRDNAKLGTTYDVLINKQAGYILFGTAPVAGTNNVSVGYSYEAPISTQAINQSASTPTIPAYALPLFDSKVHDTNITSLTTATQRGLAELQKYGAPRLVLTLKSQKFAPAGAIIYFTSTLDNINSAAFVVQTVKGSYLGNNINEYEYELGSYNPTIVDWLRWSHKTHTRSTTTSNITAPQQIDVVALENIGYRDSVSATAQPSFAAGVYGTGKYGQCSYGGSTGTYGAARYGMSTIYG